jgi:plastocyanin
MITNFAFQPKELTIPAGTTVVWNTDMGRHTVWADDGAFQSDTLRAGEQFEQTFEQPGVVHYYCDNHGDKGGKDMAGVITVTPRPQ